VKKEVKGRSWNDVNELSNYILKARMIDIATISSLRAHSVI